MSKDIKKATVEELQREIDSRTPYIFSTDIKGVTPDNVEKWFTEEWKKDCKTGDDTELFFWVWRKSDNKFLFGFASEFKRMFFTRDQLKKDGISFEEYDDIDGAYPNHNITEFQMKALKRFGKKYPNWSVARKKLNPKKTS